jgi:hypothetical protein
LWHLFEAPTVAELALTVLRALAERGADGGTNGAWDGAGEIPPFGDLTTPAAGVDWPG